jgi:cell division protein FtsL
MRLRDAVASVVQIAGSLAGLALVWQSVRFCMGKIDAPVVDYFFASLADPGASVILDWYLTALHYLMGFLMWFGLGAMVVVITDAAARILVVGFKQFCEEERAAGKEARRLERIEAARERRRELRRKANEQKSGFSVTTLVIGIIIGSMFF